ncbi:MAG: hypothetical protein U5K32_10380 [Bacteroidales bacterium]|nr:hypothetical protein [Bacteroidales bacterium]
MKYLRLFFGVLALMLVMSSCEKEADHSIRIKNEVTETITGITIGSVSYGDVPSGSTTEYKPVEEGEHTLSGGGGSLEGTVTVTGKGTHRWTLVIPSSGEVEVIEDE